MPAPSGSESQLGYSFATGVDSYGQDIWTNPVTKFTRIKNAAGFIADQTLERVENMDPSNQTLQGVPTKRLISPKFSHNPDANTVMPLLSHYLSKNPTISTPSGGASSRQWIMTPFEYGDAANATYVDSLVMELSDNDGFPVLVHGARAQDLGIKIDSGKLQSVDWGFLACSDSYTSAATQVTLGAGAYSGKPLVRGHWNQAYSAATLGVRVTAIAGGGFNGTVKWTRDGSYAGTTATPIVFGQWYRLVLNDGTRMGASRENDLWFCFPTATGTLTALDEWSFTSARTLATASYSTLTPLQAAAVEITVGGSVVYVNSAELKFSRPRKHNEVVGLIHPLTVQKNGDWMASLSIDRDRNDRDFLKKLISAESFAVAVKMYGNIIEGSIEQLWQIDLPNCQVSKRQGDITTKNTLQEKVDIIAFRSGSTDLFTHTLVGTLTAL